MIFELNDSEIEILRSPDKKRKNLNLANRRKSKKDGKIFMIFNRMDMDKSDDKVKFPEKTPVDVKYAFFSF